MALIAVGALFAAPVVLSSGAGAAQQGLNGTWDCCGAGGAAQQDFIMDNGTGTAVTPGGGEFATITDSDNNGNVKIVTNYTGSSYVATFVGTLSSDDQTMNGTWTSNSNQSGTWSATRGTAVTTGPITVAITVSPITFQVGQSTSCVVTVTAGTSALTNVSLGSGLTIDGGYATITHSPSSLSVSSIAAGASQNFYFNLEGASLGGDVVTVEVTADTSTGQVTSSAESKYDVGTISSLPTSPTPTGPTPAAAPIASSLGTPGEIFHSMAHNVVNASITVAAILFITFPANMFNNTFSANYAEILLILAGWRRRGRRSLGLKERTSRDVTVASTAPLPAVVTSDPDMPGRSSSIWFLGVLVLGAILGGLLNPHFGLNSQSFSGFGATMVSFVIGAGLSWYIAKLFRERHHYPTHTYLKALPLGLGVAAICVLISRLTSFEPGYLYGIVVSVAFVESLEDRHNAHLTVLSTFSTLCVALLAWFAWVPVNHFALNHSGNVPIAIVDDVLGSIFVGGLVGTVVGLLPLEFMPGGQLLRWRKDVWAIVFFVALFLLVEVELNPASGPTHHGGAPIVTAIVLFIGFGGSTWLMRRYFAKRVAPKFFAPALASATALAPAEVDPLLDTESGDDDEYS
jgi:hypothetical protein